MAACFFLQGCHLSVNGNSASSPGGGAQPPASDSPPSYSAPSTVSMSTAASPSFAQINLSWSDTAQSSSYLIERSSDGVNYSTVAQVPGNVFSYSDQSMSPGTRFSYRVSGAEQAPSYPIIVNSLALFQRPSGHTAPSTPAGFQMNASPNEMTPQTLQRNNIFFEDQPVVFQFSSPATSYEVRNLKGELVDSGRALASTTLNVSLPGWYKIYAYSNTADSTYGDAVGGSHFVIFRNDPNFPPLPGKNDDYRDSSGDQIMRSVTAMGPERNSAPFGSSWSTTFLINGIGYDVGLNEQFYVGWDPIRPRDLFISFSNGTVNFPTDTAQVVSAFVGQVKYYEPRNEPNTTSNPQDFATEFLTFRSQVKGANPNALIMGPGTVDITPSSIAWIDQFLSAIEGTTGQTSSSLIDAFSFHAYNAINGDFVLARENLTRLQGILQKHGLQNAPIWQTEQNYTSTMAGVYMPRHQARWTMAQFLLFEQFGIVKEHNYVWLDASGWWTPDGFPWSFSETWDDRSFQPNVDVIRVYSEEVFGTNFNKAFDFGPTGNKLYLGNLYVGPGKSVAAFMSAGLTDGQVQLTVTGSESVLHTSSATGVRTDYPITRGQVTLNVPELPVYVDLASDQTISVVPQNWGTNVAPTATLTSSSIGGNPLYSGQSNDLSKITNGQFETWYYNENTDGSTYAWLDNTPTDASGNYNPWVQLTFARPQNISKVILYANTPWSLWGAPLDYELQYLNVNNQWSTIEHVSESPNTLPVYSPLDRCTVDDFYSDRSIFLHQFVPITTTAIRILVFDVSYGGLPDALTNSVAASGDGGPHVLNVKEIEVY